MSDKEVIKIAAEKVFDQVFGRRYFNSFYVKNRNGEVLEFDPSRIAKAIYAAFCVTEVKQGQNHESVEDLVIGLSVDIVKNLLESVPNENIFDIEYIQDDVELMLMMKGYHYVAKEYIIYRENQRKRRDSGDI